MEKTIYSNNYLKLIEWLKASRQEKELSMRDLAEILDVSHSWVGKIEQGERRLDVLEYVRLCKALGIDASKGLSKLK